jgi:hypothetical protein
MSGCLLNLDIVFLRVLLVGELRIVRHTVNLSAYFARLEIRQEIVHQQLR